MPKNVLVIDPVAINRIRLATTLESGLYKVSSIASVEDHVPGGDEPDLVIVGLSGDGPGRATARITALQSNRDVPILAIDSDPTPLRRLAVLRAGAREVLPRSVPDGFLLARLRGLIRDGESEREQERRRVTAASFGFAEAGARLTPPARIAVVDAFDMLPGLPNILASDVPHRTRTCTAKEALCDESGETEAFVVVSGPERATLETLLPEFRDRSHSRHCPVLVIHPADRFDIATLALDLGASELAADTATGEELALRIEAMLERKRQRDALRRSSERSYRMAATDPLTGLYNRRYAEAYLSDLMARSGEAGRELVVMLIDLDHFKSVNDLHGHQAGDKVLCEVSHRLRDNLRACDLISRHGGEEFLVILPDTALSEAMNTAERLRMAVTSRPIDIGKDGKIDVTASIGVAVGHVEPGHTVRTGTFDVAETAVPPALVDVMAAADHALYRAKDAGRNRVVLSA